MALTVFQLCCMVYKTSFHGNKHYDKRWRSQTVAGRRNKKKTAHEVIIIYVTSLRYLPLADISDVQATQFYTQFYCRPALNHCVVYCPTCSMLLV